MFTAKRGNICSLADGAPSRKKKKKATTAASSMTLTASWGKRSLASSSSSASSSTSTSASNADFSGSAGGGGSGNSYGEKTQMVLDFDQRSFGRKVECPMCSLLYCRWDPEDRAVHAKHCEPWRYGVQMPATPWKTERAVLRGTGIGSSAVASAVASASNHGGGGGSGGSGDSCGARGAGGTGGDFRVVEVRNGSDPAAHLAKVAEVYEVMGAALGAESLVMEHTREARTYLWVNHRRRVLGCIVVEEIPRAFLEIPSATTSAAASVASAPPPTTATSTPAPAPKPQTTAAAALTAQEQPTTAVKVLAALACQESSSTSGGADPRAEGGCDVKEEGSPKSVAALPTAAKAGDGFAPSSDKAGPVPPSFLSPAKPPPAAEAAAAEAEPGALSPPSNARVVVEADKGAKEEEAAAAAATAAAMGSGDERNVRGFEYTMKSDGAGSGSDAAAAHGAAAHDAAAAAHDAAAAGIAVTGGLEADWREAATAESRRSPLLLGVRAVWVHESARRGGVATALLDAARRAAAPYGYTAVPRAAVAFTSPTAAGRAFATKYCATDRLLVFNP